ncbi:hypothetical protein KAI04_00005, partial [Candidatus Pacearchaeota archaeon]|nr:hypothetical protein [Candidatus Pacearchaeota archaeon]
MKKGGVVLVIGMLLFTIISVSFVTSEFNETEIADMPKAGTTPDSAFYGVDVFFDNARVALTFRAINKAKIRLDIMGERMAEMGEMAEKNKVIEAEKAESQVQKQMQKFEGSVEKVKKKDAPELNEHIQTHSSKLEILKQRLGDSDWAEAINDAIILMEELENIIVDIPEDLGPDSIFIISQICEEAGATTVAECQELIASGALTARVRILPANHTDPHGCSGFYVSRGIKRCCDDSYEEHSTEHKEKTDDRPLDYYYIKGTVEYKIINLETDEVEEGIETDSCDGNTLTEWECPGVMDMNTRNERFFEEYDCPHGCEDGACLI